MFTPRPLSSSVTKGDRVGRQWQCGVRVTEGQGADRFRRARICSLAPSVTSLRPTDTLPLPQRTSPCSAISATSPLGQIMNGTVLPWTIRGQFTLRPPRTLFPPHFSCRGGAKKKKKKKAERKKEKKKKSQGGSDGGDDESEIVYICASNVGLDSIQPSIYRTRMILLLQAGNFSLLKIDCCALKGWRLTE